MISSRARVPGAGWLLAPVTLFAPAAVQAAEAVRRFAAPDQGDSLPSGSASGIGQVTLALLAVLVAVFVVAALLKRLRGFAGAGAHGIEVLSQVSLGSRERAVIVRVGAERLLLGVANGNVRLLHTLPAEAPQPPATVSDDNARPTFASLLKRSLGR
jgi:flagellar protein FliO/FliZ